MVAPNLTLPTLYATGWESGTLESWAAVGPGTVIVQGATVHAGLWALEVMAPIGPNLEYASYASGFNVPYLGFDVWMTHPNVGGVRYSSMGILDTLGNFLEIRCFNLGSNLFYNGVNLAAGGAGGVGFADIRFEYDYAIASCRWWVNVVDQGLVAVAGFGQPAEMRLGVYSSPVDAQTWQFDDLVLSGEDDLLWRRRRRSWWN